MADIQCAICDESWDAYGVNHGDMKPWEATLFKAGAGCPCCEGDPPHDGRKLEEARTSHLRSIVFNAEDPDSFGLLHSAEPPPKWQRPDDPVLFECPECETKLVRDLDYNDGPNEKYGRKWILSAKAEQRRYDVDSVEWDDGFDLECLPTLEINGVAVKHCPGCLIRCDGDCGTNIYMFDETGDTYAPGASFMPCGKHRVGDAKCYDCYTEERDECARENQCVDCGYDPADDPEEEEEWFEHDATWKVTEGDKATYEGKNKADAYACYHGAKRRNEQEWDPEDGPAPEVRLFCDDQEVEEPDEPDA